jgi:hypothetical protein
MSMARIPSPPLGAEKMGEVGDSRTPPPASCFPHLTPTFPAPRARRGDMAEGL